MRPAQLTLLQSVLDAAYAACLRSAVATIGAEHLRAVLLEHLLASGCAVLEPGAEPRRARLLRLVDEVVRVERVPLPARPAARAVRSPRPPDLRVWAPERLDVEVHARGTFGRPVEGAGRALLERVGRVGARATDALLLVCDRRSYDALRRGAPGEGEPQAGRREPPALAALCAAVLPPSAELTGAFEEREADVGRGQVYAACGAVTPMVFGVQRVVVGLWMRGSARAAEPAPVAQLDAFGDAS